MKNGTYIVSSPGFPSRNDFERFPLWGDWDEPEEIPLIRSLCESEEEYQSKVIAPYEEGKETYYPILEEYTPNHKFLYAAVKANIDPEIKYDGYVCLDSNIVVAICLWIGEEDFHLLSKDRLLASEKNPGVIKAISKRCSVNEFTEIQYSSSVKLNNGKLLNGVISLK